MTEQRSEFDFAAFKDAFERKDLDRWLPFYAATPNGSSTGTPRRRAPPT